MGAPAIDPIAKEVPRPLWSVMIPTFNCGSYLQETLESVLTFGASAEEMQIEVVDDRSTTGDPESVVRAVGASRVDFYRQPENVGAICNWNTCIERSRGQLVHILHHDDYIHQDFYKRVAGAFQDWPEIAGVFTRCFQVDELNELESLSERLATAEQQPTRDPSFIYYSNPIRTPGVVVRRGFYEQHGGFLPELIYTADWEMWVRVIRRGGAIALNQPLASYRTFSGNLTNQLTRAGERWPDYLRFGQVCASEDPAGFDSRHFGDAVAKRAIWAARRYSRQGDTDAARASRRFWKEFARPSVKAGEAFRSLKRLLTR